MIAKIELTNFKSYYGTKVIGPLHKNFTSIVGPNGSGKSNTIESLLFVFGKRAKQMRLSKLSELIHKSAKHPDCEKAIVRVTFQEINDNEDDPDYFEIIPGTVFTVARRVSKNSSSQYYIDDSPQNYEVVAKLLRKKGIDLDHNRFLILQGEVEQISLMKPKAQNENETGLLEYLEDIIGSNRYVEEIEKLAQDVEQCNEQRIEQTNRVKASQNEMQGLEQERKIAVAWLKKERNFYKLTCYSNFLVLNEEVRHYNAVMETISRLKEVLREKKKEKTEKFAANQSLI